MRGNPKRLFYKIRYGGSIPASAGQPDSELTRDSLEQVYPRECGATADCPHAGPRPAGLSPRVRGNLGNLSIPSFRNRSIPASAGQPANPGKSRCRFGVYPRECGATPVAACLEVDVAGLSPRVRGNPVLKSYNPSILRSIPASAGQPFLRFSSTALDLGLSPRVRGNLCQHGLPGFDIRSIPASAGQPLQPRKHSRMKWVYPRECGATQINIKETVRGSGLSPRVRGNPERAPKMTIGLPLGLSPRVRGNRLGRSCDTVSWRSIPASAGQPPSR